jgi:putative transcriptional regulator
LLFFDGVMRLPAIVILVQIGLAQQIEVPSAKGPLAGALLIATRKSHDADLKQSVIVVVHNGPEGVIGLILNHPVSGSAYFGGPIPIGVRSLVKSASHIENGEPVLNGIYMISRRLPEGTRVFAGYVGWTQQQVRDEIAGGLWTVRKGDAAIVFDAHPETLWRRLAR